MLDAETLALDAEMSMLDAETSVLDAETSALDAETSALGTETSVLCMATSVLCMATCVAILAHARSFRRYQRGVSGDIGHCGVGITPLSRRCLTELLIMEIQVLFSNLFQTCFGAAMYFMKVFWPFG